MSFPNNAGANSPRDPPQEPGRELRWPLRSLLLYAQVAILGLILLGFGTATYFLVRRGVFEQAESDLLGAARLTMERVQQGENPADVEIDTLYLEKFGLAPRDRAYAIIEYQGRRQEFGEFPDDFHPPDRVQDKKHRPFHSRAYGHYLEVWINGRGDDRVLIGRPLAKEFDRLNRVLYSLLGAGAACLLIGIGLAWLLALRIVEPLARLTVAAENVTSDALDQHVDDSTQISEIHRLGSVLNRMLVRLDSAFRRQMRFTADASHELRTPVTVLMAQAEHALAKNRTDSEYRFALETCLSAGRSMRRLIDSLLLLARADSGRLQIEQRTVRLDTLAGENADLLSGLAAEREQRIETELRPTSVLGDPGRLAQVVNNLVANAIQYGKSSGCVSITVEADGEDGKLIVRDDGIGIAASDQPRLFERFFRADAARQHDADQGAGLGLAIVAEIVRAHGGHIVMQSQLGSGTIVTVRLPLTDKHNSEPSSASDSNFATHP